MQNIYDNLTFFSGYQQLRKDEKGFNALLEQPAIRSLLPNLSQSVVVDLGCGFGDFCLYARKQGAQSVLGIDISKRMLDVAQENTQDDAIEYQCRAIENFSVNPNSVDVVVSSLALHYVEDYGEVVKKVYNCLKLDGYFVFSVEHPICTANPSTEVMCTSDGKQFFGILNYRDEGQFQQNWFVKNVIKYHRTVQTYVNTLIECGFSIQKLLEPMPTDAMIVNRSHFAIHKSRPPLLIIKAFKRNDIDKLNEGGYSLGSL